MKKNIFLLKIKCFFLRFFKSYLIRKIENVCNFEDISWLPFISPNDENAYCKKTPVLKTLDPNARTFHITITNDSDKEQPVILFGAIKDFSDTKIDSSIKINLLESSYAQLKADLLSTKYIMRGIKIFTTGQSELKSPIRICHGTTTGVIESRPFYPIFYQGCYSMHISKDEYALVIDKNTYWEIDICPHDTVNIIFTLLAEIHIRDTFIYL